MKKFSTVITFILIISAVQIQRLNAQMASEKNAESGNILLVAYNSANEITAGSYMLLSSTNNLGKSPIYAEHSGEGKRKSNNISPHNSARNTPEQVTLLEMSDLLKIDSEDSVRVEQWMVSPKDWIITN